MCNVIYIKYSIQKATQQRTALAKVSLLVVSWADKRAAPLVVASVALKVSFTAVMISMVVPRAVLAVGSLKFQMVAQ